MRASLRRGQTAAMSPDDRLADPEPHAHAIRLRREEGVENAIGRSRVEARASVFDGDEHARRFDGLRCYCQRLRAVRHRAHGVNRAQLDRTILRRILLRQTNLFHTQERTAHREAARRMCQIPIT